MSHNVFEYVFAILSALKYLFSHIYMNFKIKINSFSIALFQNFQCVFPGKNPYPLPLKGFGNSRGSVGSDAISFSWNYCIFNWKFQLGRGGSQISTPLVGEGVWIDFWKHSMSENDIINFQNFPCTPRYISKRYFIIYF